MDNLDTKRTAAVSLIFDLSDTNQSRLYDKVIVKSIKESKPVKEVIMEMLLNYK